MSDLPLGDRDGLDTLAVSYDDLIARLTSATIRARADLDTITYAIENIARDRGYAGAVLFGGSRDSLIAASRKAQRGLVVADDETQQDAAEAVAVLVYELTVDPSAAPICS